MTTTTVIIIIFIAGNLLLYLETERRCQKLRENIESQKALITGLERALVQSRTEARIYLERALRAEGVSE